MSDSWNINIDVINSSLTSLIPLVLNISFLPIFKFEHVLRVWFGQTPHPPRLPLTNGPTDDDEDDEAGAKNCCDENQDAPKEEKK